MPKRESNEQSAMTAGLSRESIESIALLPRRQCRYGSVSSGGENHTTVGGTPPSWLLRVLMRSIGNAASLKRARSFTPLFGVSAHHTHRAVPFNFMRRRRLIPKYRLL